MYKKEREMERKERVKEWGAMDVKEGTDSKPINRTLQIGIQCRPVYLMGWIDIYHL